jgi:peptidoglycan/xylan/chitin deacetylase (PgdA/CDA1 family)
LIPGEMMKHFVLLLLALLFGALWNAQAIESQGETHGELRRTVALTFDDLPEVFSRDVATMRRNTTELLRTLKLHRAPAIGFVNEGKLHRPGEIDARTAVLKQWVDAGMTLGNHTFSHLRLLNTPLLAYEDDVIKGEVITRQLMSARQPYQLYFRHPYTSTGPNKEVKAAFESFLRERGYKVAPFTIENSDYIFNQIYFDASRNKDTALMERLHRTYLDYNDAQFEFFERLSIETFGREISQILLIHANDINADCLDELLKRLEARGYRFVTLDQAMEDKAYQTRDDYIGLHGPSWMHRWTVSLGLTMKLNQEPDPPKWVLDMFKR